MVIAVNVRLIGSVWSRCSVTPIKIKAGRDEERSSTPKAFAVNDIRVAREVLARTSHWRILLSWLQDNDNGTKVRNTWISNMIDRSRPHVCSAKPEQSSRISLALDTF